MSDNKPFDDLLDDAQMLAAWPGGPICLRTLDNRINEGLPYLKVGKRRLFRIDAVRAWLLSHEIDRTPRRPGRPAQPRRALAKRLEDSTP